MNSITNRLCMARYQKCVTRRYNVIAEIICLLARSSRHPTKITPKITLRGEMDPLLWWNTILKEILYLKNGDFIVFTFTFCNPVLLVWVSHHFFSHCAAFGWPRCFVMSVKIRRPLTSLYWTCVANVVGLYCVLLCSVFYNYLFLSMYPSLPVLFLEYLALS